MPITKNDFLRLGVRRLNYQFSYGLQSTSYSIVRPSRQKADSYFVDFSIYKPTRNLLYKEQKDVKLFSRFLRLICASENRLEDHKKFLNLTHTDGLTVEADVYLTVPELLAIMWKNGYTQDSRTAIQVTLPSDYKFHSAELAALFQIDENSAYDFALQFRKDKNHIGELDWNKIKSKGLIRTHWATYFTGLTFLAHFAFNNYYFMFKTFGTSLWFGTNYLLFSRYLKGEAETKAATLRTQTSARILQGESKILSAMQIFTKDRDALENVSKVSKIITDSGFNNQMLLLKQIQSNLKLQTETRLKQIRTSEAELSNQIIIHSIKTISNELVELIKNTKSASQKFMESEINYLESLSKNTTSTTKSMADKFADDVINGLTLPVEKRDPHIKKVIEKIETFTKNLENDFVSNLYISKSDIADVEALKKEIKFNGELPFDNESPQMKKLLVLYERLATKAGLVSLTNIMSQEFLLPSTPNLTDFHDSIVQQYNIAKETYIKSQLVRFLNSI